jgi:hypothetical protein
MGMGGFPGGMHMQRPRFEETYHCYSVAFADKAHLEVRAAVKVPVVVLMSRSPSNH